MIYLDNAATTRPFDEVIKEVEATDKECFANPSSMHAAGYLAEKKIRKAETAVKEAIGADRGTVLFTSGGTESNNLAFFGTLFSVLKRGVHIITTKIEHPSVLEPVRCLEALGADVTYVGTDENGFVNPDEILENIKEDTRLVSVMYVNNETGAIQPIEEIAKKVKAKNKNILLHTDCVQALGAVNINVKKAGIDMLSLSAHKINGPKGVGAFYFSDNVHIKPVIVGGHQQNNLRSGTQNTPGICGFEKALFLTLSQKEERRAHSASLKERLINGLKGNPAFTVNNESGQYAPHIISIWVHDVRAEVLLHALEAHDICVSAGSACSSNKPEPSHVLAAMGYDKKRIEETIRVSTGAFTKEKDIDTFLEVLTHEASALARFTRV